MFKPRTILTLAAIEALVKSGNKEARRLLEKGGYDAEIRAACDHLKSINDPRVGNLNDAELFTKIKTGLKDSYA